MKNRPWGSLGGSLGVPGGCLGAKMAPRLVPWPNLGSSWSQLGANLDQLGANLGSTWGKMTENRYQNGHQTGPKLIKNWSETRIIFLHDLLIDFWSIFDVFLIKNHRILGRCFEQLLSNIRMWKSSKTIEKTMVFKGFSYVGLLENQSKIEQKSS